MQEEPIPRVVGADDMPSGMTPIQFRRLRKRLGLAQVDLGVILGVRGDQVSRYERGLTPITNRRMAQILKLAKDRTQQGANGR